MIRKILFFAVFACVASVLAKPSAYDLKQARRDSNFRVLERLFNIVDVKTEYSCYQKCVEKSLKLFDKWDFVYKEYEFVYYTVWAVPKVRNPLSKVGLKKFLFVFKFDLKKETFDEIPLQLMDDVYAAIRKNMSFEKWLKREVQEPKSGFNLAQNDFACIEYREREYIKELGVSFDNRTVTKDELFRKIGISGKYVGTLKIGAESKLRFSSGPIRYYLHNNYEFWLSDNGDVLVAEISSYAGRPFIEYKGPFHIERCKEPEKFSIPFDCYYSIISNEKCLTPISKTDVPYRFPQFCSYMIIRHDGTIEYGPKSGDM